MVRLPEMNPESLPENQAARLPRATSRASFPLFLARSSVCQVKVGAVVSSPVLRGHVSVRSGRDCSTLAGFPRGDNRGHEIISVLTNGPYLRLMSAPRKPPSSQLISPSSCHRSFGVPSLPITSSDILSALIGGWLHLFGVLRKEGAAWREYRSVRSFTYR